MRGLKTTCSFPMVRGFCRMTLLHCAGHRNSNNESVNGKHCPPSKPQPLFDNQYVAVHPIDEDAGVMNDCAREKNANPMMYAAPRRSKSHGLVNG